MGVTLELLDEAKIDIIKIFNLATLLMSPDGEAQVRKRLQIVTDNKIINHPLQWIAKMNTTKSK